MLITPSVRSEQPVRRRSPTYALPDGICCVVLQGGLRSDATAAVIAHEAEWLILDLRGIAAPTDAVLEALREAISRAGRRFDRTCAVTEEPTSAAPVATFASVGDARQAKLFAEAGFGPGWAPARG